ncbi:hypothetical protein [Rubrivivax rivuli]|uniref:Uncharacterized protein n=1 Tax=Rubrivivax rivuli TaxID=1862385 RepID=A0A437RJV9_9BURK|nr:hypothetical protein [Rubrivivax rivuli]RVU47071.1 hypothetical protein EOE66_04705 [Rubrivivax rivuli]
MSELTGFDLLRRREHLESTAASLLGRMLFEYSRLDMAAGLCAVWVDEGRLLKELTPRVQAMSFHKKLEFIDAAVDRNIKKSKPSYRNYKLWLNRANTVRVVRNELVHGRWGVEAASEHVVNVIGLPTSEDQREVRYRLEDLEAILAELKDLQIVLYKLREQRPL